MLDLFYIDSKIEAFPLAKDNVASLKTAKEYSFCYSLNNKKYPLFVKLLPQRSKSIEAKIDKETLASRPCFLCKHVRPPEQLLQLFKNYEILINPYPILNRHLVISNIEHQDQLIKGKFLDMLELTALLEGFAVTYNGPKSGASAPNHFHFQAVPCNSNGIDRVELPLFTYWRDTATFIKSLLGVDIYLNDNPFSKNIVLTSSDKIALNTVFEKILPILEFIESENKLNSAEQLENNRSNPEPKLNIATIYNASLKEFTSIIFPREESRPKEFFMPEPTTIHFSPGTIEMCGIYVLSREIDYNKKSNFEPLIEQTLYSKSKLETLKKLLSTI